MKFTFSAEPAVWIGLIASILVAVITQVVGSGLITNADGLNTLNALITIIPVVAGLLIRQFVTPVATPAPTPPPPAASI